MLSGYALLYNRARAAQQAVDWRRKMTQGNPYGRRKSYTVPLYYFAAFLHDRS